MLKLGFIGLGQVGGGVADLAKEFDYKAMALNTANVDLNVLKNLEKEEKIHLLGYEGAGKDRSIGEEAFITHQDMIKDRISEHFKDCHAIFPVFALGGGTGSGMCSLITKMLVELFQEKVISPIMFLPDEKEAPRAKMNALEAFSEISAIEETGATFILDNQRILELNQSFSLKEKFRYTRNDLLQLLDIFNQKTEQESDITNLDKMDLLTTLSERGCAMITEVSIDTEDIKDSEKMGERLINALQFSPFAKTELSNISRAAMIVDLPTELTAFLRAESTFEKIGFPLEIFTGIYEVEQKPKLYTLITGLSYPLTALKELEESVKKEEKRIIESLEHTRKQSFSVNTSWTSSLKRDRKVKI